MTSTNSLPVRKVICKSCGMERQVFCAHAVVEDHFQCSLGGVNCGVISAKAVLTISKHSLKKLGNNHGGRHAQNFIHTLLTDEPKHSSVRKQGLSSKHSELMLVAENATSELQAYGDDENLKRRRTQFISAASQSLLQPYVEMPLIGESAAVPVLRANYQAHSPLASSMLEAEVAADAEDEDYLGVGMSADEASAAENEECSEYDLPAVERVPARRVRVREHQIVEQDILKLCFQQGLSDIMLSTVVRMMQERLPELADMEQSFWHPEARNRNAWASTMLKSYQFRCLTTNKIWSARKPPTMQKRRAAAKPISDMDLLERVWESWHRFDCALKRAREFAGAGVHLTSCDSRILLFNADETPILRSYRAQSSILLSNPADVDARERSPKCDSREVAGSLLAWVCSNPEVVRMDNCVVLKKSYYGGPSEMQAQRRKNARDALGAANVYINASDGREGYFTKKEIVLQVNKLAKKIQRASSIVGKPHACVLLLDAAPCHKFAETDMQLLQNWEHAGVFVSMLSGRVTSYVQPADCGPVINVMKRTSRKHSENCDNRLSCFEQSSAWSEALHQMSKANKMRTFEMLGFAKEGPMQFSRTLSEFLQKIQHKHPIETARLHARFRLRGAAVYSVVNMQEWPPAESSERSAAENE
jgi:hypothetical protein